MKKNLRFTILTFLLFLGISGVSWGQYLGSGTFTKISTLTELTDGYYVITNNANSFAMSNAHNGTLLASVSVSPSSNEIINPSATIVWKIETNEGGRTIYSEDTQKYVSYTGSSNNIQIVDNVSANNQRWNFTLQSGDFQAANLQVTTRFLRYNPTSPRFVAYATGQQNLSLYKLEITNTNDPEPTNHVTNLTSENIGTSEIKLSWNDATGGDLPFAYLILANTTNVFADPVDGVDPVIDTDLSDGTAVVKVLQGVEEYSFTNFVSQTNYYFKIYPYSNSGDNIDFKIDGTVPITTIVSPELPCVNEDFSNFGVTSGWNLSGASVSSGILEFSSNNGFAILPSLNKPSFLSFTLARTTNATNKTFLVEVSTTSSTDGFTTIASYNHSNTTSGGTTTLNIPLSNYTYFDNVYIRFSKVAETSSPWRLDNVVVGCDSDFSGTLWSNDTWSNGLPDITKPVLIQGNFTTTANLEANSLTVDSGVFTIASGTSVTVEGAVVNNAAATNFIVENNGNLFQNTTVANVGAITVRSNSQPLMRLDYTLWSSPVAGQNLKAFSPNTLSPRFYIYDETSTTGNTTTNNGTYVTVLTSANESTYNFIGGKGYLIRTPNNHATSPTVYNGVFTGVPQNGNFSFTLSNAQAGYNLVGNPYPSSIDLNAFFTANTAVESTVWFWRKSNGAVGDGYVTANNLGYTFPDQTADGATNIAIRSGQGFFVKATGAGSVSFNNGIRSTNSTSTFFRNTTDSEMPSRVWFQVANSEEVLASALLGYTSAATLGVDAGFDSKPFGNKASLVSLIGTEGYAIQGRSSFEVTDQVALGFEAATAGNYSIAIANKDGVFASGQAIYLQDLAQNSTHDFASGAYNFVSEVGTFNNRFRIVYETQTLGIDDVTANNAYVFDNNGVLTVANTKEEIKAIVIYDIQGRVLLNASAVNANQWKATAMAKNNQVLLVQVTTASGISTTKTVF